MGEIDHLGAAQVVDERTGGSDSRRMLVESEPLEPTGTELVEQHATGRLGFERPAIDQGGRQTRFGDRGRQIASAAGQGVADPGDDDLSWSEHRELVGQRPHAIGAGVFGGGELAG